MKMRKHHIKIIFVTICLLTPITSAQAAIKCWVNKDKVRECGQSVPPEYSQQRIEVINDKGIVIKVIERTKTPEELAEFRRQPAGNNIGIIIKLLGYFKNLFACRL